MRIQKLGGRPASLFRSDFFDMQAYTEYDIYIPLTSKDGTRFSPQLIQGIKESLIDRFGGLTETSFESKGHWKMGPITVRDDIRIWRVLDEAPSSEFLAQFQKRLEERLRQEKILIVKRSVQIL